MTSADSTRLPGLVAPITPAASTSQTSRTRTGCCVTAVARRFMTSPLVMDAEGAEPGSGRDGTGGRAGSPQHAPRRGAEAVGGLGDACRERGLGLAAPRPRVEGRLAPDAPVDAEDAVVVAEDVVGDSARERVLQVGVDVHLDDAVADRGADVVRARAAAAVKDVLEARARMGGRQRRLALAEDLRAEPHRARRVDAVDVAERRRQE